MIFCVHQLLDKHKVMESMVELLKIYQEEDEAYGCLVEATTELYQYLLQPFRDMRELAMLRRQQIKVSVRQPVQRNPAHVGLAWMHCWVFSSMLVCSQVIEFLNQLGN